MTVVLCSFSLLWGPVNHMKHLLSADRLPFTVAYFGTMAGTLYFALSVSTLYALLLVRDVCFTLTEFKEFLLPVVMYCIGILCYISNVTL